MARLGGARAAIVMAALMALGGCDGGRKAQASADEQAKGFVPPSVMTRLDYGGIVERRFRALDRNGDDYITADELPAKDSKLIALDRNHDGRISATEWSEGMLSRFDRMDGNRDGSVTSGEREAMKNE